MAEFTDYDAVITDGATSVNLIQYEADTQTALFRGIQQKTDLLPPRPPRQDITSPTNVEQSPAYGDIFGQGDFSGGMGQRRYHSEKRDPKKYWYSSNIDIVTPGSLKLLHDATSRAVSSTTIGRDIEIANNLPFVIDNTGSSRVKRGDGNFPGSWTVENPGGGAVNVDDLTSSGDELYAAQVNVYRRNSAGTWSLFLTKATNNIDRIAFLKGRLMVTDGLSIYEVTASGGTLGSTYLAIETLPPGNRFECLFEYGEYIYASVINTTTNRSSIHHFGLNQNVTAIEKKGETALPTGQLIYSGCQYMGIGYIGGGVIDGASATNMHPVVYQCAADARGFLTLIKLAEDKDVLSSTDQSVKAFEAYGESMYMGWDCYVQNTTNDIRTGLAVHHLARDAFANHLEVRTDAGTSMPVLSIKAYRGRLLFICGGGGANAGLYYEDLAKFAASGHLISSYADFNNSGQKIWDIFEGAYKPLAAGEQVQLSYALDDAVATTTAFTDTVLNSTGKTITVTTNAKSRIACVHWFITPGTSSLTTPSVKSFSIRSNPSPVIQEYILTRYFRVLGGQDRKDSIAQPVFTNADTVRGQLEAMANRWVTFAEPNKTWTAFVVGVSDVSPMVNDVRVSGGDDPDRKAYVIQIQMIAR